MLSDFDGNPWNITLQLLILHPLHRLTPLGPLGFDFAQHRQTLRPSVEGTRSKALRPFGLQ